MLEEFAYIDNPSMWRNRPFLFVFFILLVALFGIGILLIMVWYIFTLIDKIQVTEKKIIWTHGLLSKNYVEVSIDHIRTINIYQSFIQRICDAGNIEIYSAGDEPEVYLKGLPFPNKLKNIIEHNKDKLS